MADISTEEKIVACTNDVNSFFDTANQASHGLTRMEWLRQYRTAHNLTDIDMFAFNADDILRENIPSTVVGCSGRADLFAKFAMEKYGIAESDIKIVPMVDIKSQRDVYLGRVRKKVPDGHQIVAVKSNAGWYMIDPGAGRKRFDTMRISGPENIDIKDKIGKIVKYNTHRVYRIADILTPDEHARINSLEKLGAVYKQVEPDYKSFPDKLRAGTKSLIAKIKNLNFMRSKNSRDYE